jgi:hypothetical protein
MAWTTPETAVAGTTLTAAFLNTNLRDNTNFLYTPPMVQVYRTSDLTSYVASSAITWQAENYDTDSMWSSGTNVTINTSGIYLVEFSGLFSASATLTAVFPEIQLNGTRVRLVRAGFTVTDSYFSIVSTLKLAATNTISAGIDAAGGSGYILRGNANINNIITTRMSVSWVGFAS